MTTLLFLLACNSLSPLDELPGAPAGGKHDLVVGWVDPSEASRWLEVSVTADSAPARLWRQEVSAAGRTVGAIAFDETVRVEIRSPETGEALGEPLELPNTGGVGVAVIGGVTVSYEIGVDLEPANPKVDARPGLPEGWWAPKLPGAGPLVVGMPEADAIAGWDLPAGTSSRRTLTPTVLGARVRGLARVQEGRVTSIQLTLAGDACEKAETELGLQYGATGTTWIGGRSRVDLVRSGKGCSVTFGERSYEPPKPKVTHGVGGPANPKVDARPGLPDGWLEPKVPNAAPLIIGMAEAEAVAGWPVDPGTTPMRALGGLTRADGGGVRVRGFVNFAEGRVSGIQLLLSGDECDRAETDLGALYGEDASWVGEHHRAHLLRAGESCSLSFSKWPAEPQKPAEKVPPSAVLEKRPGPPEGWVTPKVPSAPPMIVGMTEDDALANWQVSNRAQGSARTFEGVDGEGGKGTCFFKGGVVQKIELKFSDPSCVGSQARLEAAYGPGTPSLAGQWNWNGETAKVNLSPLGESSCYLWWSKS